MMDRCISNLANMQQFEGCGEFQTLFVFSFSFLSFMHVMILLLLLLLLVKT
jgi:hypothetical protein